MSPPPRTISLGERKITRIGLGTNRLTDTPENRAFLEAAVDAGIDHIDTAHLYTGGESEPTVGAALSPFAGGLTVATKGGYRAEGGIDALRDQLEESFRRLRVDTIHLYYAHRIHDEIGLEPTVELLAEQREAGRIENIGISEVSVEQIQQAQAIAPIAAVQNEYNLGERMHDDVVDFCAENGIAFVAFYPLHGGDENAVAEIAERHDATPNQIKLAWLLRRSPNLAAIPGTLSAEHAEENLAALDIELSDEDFERLRG